MVTRIAAVLFVGTALFFAQEAHAQGAQPFRCSDGTMAHLASDAEANAASPKGSIVAGKTYVCTVPQAGITAEVGEAKEYLKSLRRSAGTCNTAGDASFAALNDTFAVCAARFLKAAQEKYGAIEITSAARLPGQQKCVCPVAVKSTCAPVGQSNHERGVALDVWPYPRNDSISLTLHEFARANPQFGICFPLDTRDRPHMILAGVGGGESENCARQGITKACSGAPPLSINTPAPVTASPSAQFAQTLRQALGMQPAQPAYATQPIASQPLSQSQSPLAAFDASVSTPLVSSSLLTSSPLSTTTPIADRLEQLAFERPATSPTTTVAVPLVINPNDRGGVQSTGAPPQGTGVAWIGAGITQNTFTMSAPAPTYTTPLPATTYQTVLNSLRTILQTMLRYLKPFGRATDDTTHME